MSANRKFGEYQGVERKTTEPDAFGSLPKGYSTGKKTRCTDNFVRYPYPKLYSNYKQNFYGSKLKDAGAKSHKEAFNLEKETKIINPHKMELATTTKTTHTGAKGEKARPRKQDTVKEERPIQKHSSYQQDYPNWANGRGDTFIEKTPQYPFYSVPFRGHSSYKNSFTADKISELRRLKERVEKDAKAIT